MKPYNPDSPLLFLVGAWQRYNRKASLIFESLRQIEGQLKALGFEVTTENGKTMFRSIRRVEQQKEVGHPDGQGNQESNEKEIPHA